MVDIPMTTIAPPLPPPKTPYPDYDSHEAERVPWKYSGYRVFSRWVASDQAWFIVRRFGALNTRVILALQDEIVQLDQSLDEIDEELSRKAIDDSTNNGSFRYDPSNRRRDLILNTLPKKLLKYSMYRVAEVHDNQLTWLRQIYQPILETRCTPGRRFRRC